MPVKQETTVEIAAKSEVQHNAYSMHAGTKTAPNTKPMAGSGRHGLGVKGESFCS
jgi:hypothetical protein